MDIKDKDKVRIVSDGTAKGTRCFYDDKELKGINKIIIDDIKPNGRVSATISFVFAELDLIAEVE